MARKRKAPISQIAEAFGISGATTLNWLKTVDSEDGARLHVTEKETGELRDARKRTRLLLEHENEILRGATAFFARELPPK